MIKGIHDIRWRQRFQNFEKSFILLQNTIKIQSLSDAEKGGLIQFYETTFELSWKVIKDYLEEEGYTINSPREAIKQAFQSNIISDGEGWLHALKDRNLTSHIYDESIINSIIERIKEKYFDLLNDFYNSMKKRIP